MYITDHWSDFVHLLSFFFVFPSPEVGQSLLHRGPPVRVDELAQQLERQRHYVAGLVPCIEAPIDTLQ